MIIPKVSPSDDELVLEGFFEFKNEVTSLKNSSGAVVVTRQEVDVGLREFDAFVGCPDVIVGTVNVSHIHDVGTSDNRVVDALIVLVDGSWEDLLDGGGDKISLVNFVIRRGFSPGDESGNDDGSKENAERER